MKNLVLTSILVVVFAGCTPSVFRGFRQSDAADIREPDAIPWFSDSHSVYNSGIDAFGEHYSGLMIIKPLPERDFRVVFINELGMKIFDMEFFSNGEFTLHHCIEFLNKKFIINTLKNDISLALNNQNLKVIRVYKGQDTGKYGFKARDDNGIKYLLVDDRSRRIEKIIRKGGIGKQAAVNFFSSDATEPDSVKISHRHIKLNIHLTRINENL